MFAWILILSSWVAALSLILHDATKEDSDGSVISIAAKNFKAFIFWAILKVRKLRGALNDRTSPTSVSKSPVKVMAAVKAISSSSIQHGGPSVIKLAPALPPRKRWWLRDHRVSVTIPELELAILEEVKNAAPGCEDFVGVIVRHQPPKSRPDPNWAVQGVRFGKADRKMVNEALAAVVERMQREYLLGND